MPPLIQTKPYWQTNDCELVKLYLGNVLKILPGLPSKSVHTIITSPPYWGLRNYGTAMWEGGSKNCDHKSGKDNTNHKGDIGQKLIGGNAFRNSSRYVNQGNLNLSNICSKCGAKRIDSQLGSEKQMDCGVGGTKNCGECFVCSIVKVFRLCKRVLHPSGTLWLNLGDTYGLNVGKGFDTNKDGGERKRENAYQSFNTNLSSGNLCGVPWRVALALQSDGWILRQDIIWHKPSPMPESVTNRCTKAHEHLFLFSLSNNYYCDMEAIKRNSPFAGNKISLGDKSMSRYSGGTTGNAAEGVDTYINPNMSNPRDVWSIDDNKSLFSYLEENYPEVLSLYLKDSENKGDTWRIASEGYPGRHFATFPGALVRDPIRAGSSEKGVCPTCLTPWKRVVSRIPLRRNRPNDYTKRVGENGTGSSCANSVDGVEVRTLGWKPSCRCYDVEIIERPLSKPGKRADEKEEDYLKRLEPWEESMLEWEEKWKELRPIYEELEVKPATVMDPFIGSGTTCLVALEEGRNSVGIDLSKDYLDNHAIERIRADILQRPGVSNLV